MRRRTHSASGKVLNYDTMKCGNCGNLVLVFWSASSLSFGHNGMHAFKSIPWPQKTTRFPEHWPPDVGRYWVQARRSLEGKNWDAAAVMARSAVQLIVRYQKAEGKTLKQEIDSLGAKGILPPVMVEWSHGVLGCWGTRTPTPTPGDEGTEQKDATDVVEFLGQLMSTTYDSPYAIEQYRERRKK